MTLSFRPALPEDAPHAAPLIHSAGPAMLDYAFSVKKHAAIDFVRFAFGDGYGILGYANHVAAELDGRVAAVGAFYPASDFERLSREMVWQVFRFYGILRGAGVLRQSARLEALTPQPRRDALFIQNIGVVPDMRRQGICSALLENRIDLARQNGYRACILDVADTNTRARRLYEKFGFRVVAKHRWPYTEASVRVPDHIRMERAL